MKHYVRTWFPIDVLASIPFELMAKWMGLDLGSQAAALAILKVIWNKPRVFSRLAALNHMQGSSNNTCPNSR